jgi:hypothetical protein
MKQPSLVTNRATSLLPLAVLGAIFVSLFAMLYALVDDVWVAVVVAAVLPMMTLSLVRPKGVV